jgi:RNA polymerase sigma-70 factor (ECF subfamily)
MAEENSLEKILEGCKQGRDESFEELINIYSTKVYGYYSRLTNDKTIAEDLTSELFVKLVEKIDTYKDGNFNSWLFRTASNIFYDYLRKKKRRKDFYEKEFELQQQQNHSPQTSTEDWEYLQYNLQQLDDETRELITLRYYSGMSFKEISRTRSEPIGTTLSKVHRGLKRLKTLLSKGA